jgi:hypothetical protein
MNLEKVQAYITLYKEHFQYLHEHEWYKWRAVKTFQDNWDIGAKDFEDMFNRSVAQTYNLLQGPSEYSRDIMWSYITKDAEFVRSMFTDLYDESQEITSRIEAFTLGARELQRRHSKPGENHHQTARAIGAYLTLRYPDRYYFYKTEMVRAYFKAVDYPVKINQRRTSKFTVYYHACDLLRNEIQKDQKLVSRHLSRLNEDCYYDDSLHLLTQDLIYAIAVHLPHINAKISEDVPEQKPVVNSWSEGGSSVSSSKYHPTFQGSHADFEGSQKRNKQLGTQGELWVIEVEKQKLIEAGRPSKADKVKHIASEEGDGTGYDILSYDKNTGKEILIEVKTTTGNSRTPFYLTRTEVERSKVDSKKYRLYRVYDFDDLSKTASIKEFRGDLGWMCYEPTQYMVRVSE